MNRQNRPSQRQRRSPRLRARTTNSVLPHATASIVALARTEHQRAQPFPFARLPGELRNLVYEYVVLGQDEAAGPQGVADERVALPGLARAGRALRAEYLAAFFRHRLFGVDVFCDVEAFWTLRKVRLVAAFLGSVDDAVAAMPGTAATLAQSAHYGCLGAMSRRLPRLWAEAHAPGPDDDGTEARAARAACAASGPLLAHVRMLVGPCVGPPLGPLYYDPDGPCQRSSTLRREPVTGRIVQSHGVSPALRRIDNDTYLALAKNAYDVAMRIFDSKDGTFQGWSWLEILEICGEFRYWRNFRCPQEFADDDSDDDSDDDDNDDDSGEEEEEEEEDDDDENLDEIDEDEGEDDQDDVFSPAA